MSRIVLAYAPRGHYPSIQAACEGHHVEFVEPTQTAILGGLRPVLLGVGADCARLAADIEGREIAVQLHAVVLIAPAGEVDGLGGVAMREEIAKARRGESWFILTSYLVDLLSTAIVDEQDHRPAELARVMMPSGLPVGFAWRRARTLIYDSKEEHDRGALREAMHLISRD